MLTKSKKAKGKALEKYVAKAFLKIFNYAYSRADSGSGKYQKEDVTIPSDVPLFIECKNQATLNLKGWWDQTTFHCPESKFPVLIYKLNYQQVPTVVMEAGDLVRMMSQAKQMDDWTKKKLSLDFNDFMEIVKSAYAK